MTSSQNGVKTPTEPTNSNNAAPPVLPKKTYPRSSSQEHPHPVSPPLSPRMHATHALIASQTFSDVTAGDISFADDDSEVSDIRGSMTSSHLQHSLHLTSSAPSDANQKTLTKSAVHNDIDAHIPCPGQHPADVTRAKQTSITMSLPQRHFRSAALEFVSIRRASDSAAATS